MSQRDHDKEVKRRKKSKAKILSKREISRAEKRIEKELFKLKRDNRERLEPYRNEDHRNDSEDIGYDESS
jgi:hypothetical protein